MNSVNTFSSSEAVKFREVLENSRLTYRKFGETLGISEQQVSNIINGARKPSREVLCRLAEKYGVDPHQFITGGAGEETAYIPLDDVEAAAGRGIEAPEYTEKNLIAVAKCLLAGHDTKSVRALKVRGDSMVGEGINDGDIAFFNTKQKEGEAIFVLSVGSDVLIKRVIKDSLNGKITLRSANDKYPDRVISGEDMEHVRIAGKVIGWMHNV